MGCLIVDNNIHNQVQNIINEYSNLNNNFGLSKTDISSILNANGKINYNKSNNLKNLYNSFYNSNLQLEDLYNTLYIKDYLLYKNQNQADYGNNNESSFLDKFLSITRFIKNKTSNALKYFNDGFIAATRDKKILIFILFVIILGIFLIIKSYNTIFQNQNTSNIDLGRTEQFINK